MTQINIGGNLLDSTTEKKSLIFHSSIYFYAYYKDFNCIAEDTKNLSSFTIYSLTGNVQIVIEGQETQSLKKNEYLIVQNYPLINIKGEGEILLTGSADSSADPFFSGVLSLEECKTVSKPWGKEYWLVATNSHYSFKHIVLRKGFKTSLQYHNEKIETNFLYQGEALFHYNDNISAPINTETMNIKTQQFHGGDYIHVTNLTIHRIEALSDLQLFEISTPQLDDVVRIQDDSKRPDGRIEDEHK